MRSLNRLLLPILLLAATLPGVAQTALDPSRVVASVNGEEIKAEEYYRRLEWFRLDEKSVNTGFPAGFLTIKQMITERLILQLAKGKGVLPTKTEVDAAAAETLESSPNLLKELVAAGRTEEEFRDQVRFELAQFKLRTVGIAFTDQEVERHYRSYPEEFRIPKKYRLRIIVVKTDAQATAVDADLKAGKDFASVAISKSLDATNLSGGFFGELSESELSPAIKDALAPLKAGETTGWASSASKDGITTRVKFLVEAITPSSTRPLDNTLKRSIRRMLMLNKGDVINKVGAELQQASINAKIVINQPEFQKLYTQFLLRFGGKAPEKSGS